MDLVFRLIKNQNRTEMIDAFTLVFPLGIIPNSSPNLTFPTSTTVGGIETLNLPISGQTISWGIDNNDQLGGINTTSLGVTFTVNVTIDASVVGNQYVSFHASNDSFLQPTGPYIVDAPGTGLIFDASNPITDIKTEIIGVLTSPTTIADKNNCMLGVHTISVKITNNGSTIGSNIPIYYEVNGVIESIDTITSSLSPGDFIVDTFSVPYNFSPQNIYNIKAWTAVAGDGALVNDTNTITISNSIPITLSNLTQYINGVETAYEVGSVNLDWTGIGTPFGLSTINFHSGAKSFYLTILGSSPTGTYESFVNLPCVDVSNGDVYRISYWRKCSASGTLTVNGQTGIFTGLGQAAASMTNVLKPYSPMTPTTATGVNGWTKDSIDYVSTANETRYFAIGGQVTIAGASTKGNVRLDDFKIRKVSGSVGIRTITANDAISILPNPTSGILNINVSETNTTIEIVNVIGDKVYTNFLIEGNNSVDLSSLSNGTYFATIKFNNQIVTKKVILSK